MFILLYTSYPSRDLTQIDFKDNISLEFMLFSLEFTYAIQFC